MANSQSDVHVFQDEILSGIHASARPLRAAPRRRITIKAALYLTTASIGASTTAYSSTNELAATGNYTSGGATVYERDGAHVFRHHGLLDALGVGVLDLFHVLRRVRRGAVLQLVAVEQGYRRADLLLAVDHVRHVLS